MEELKEFINGPIWSLVMYAVWFWCGYTWGFRSKRDKVLKSVSRDTIAKYSREASEEHFEKSEGQGGE